jgi:predicted transcriptional regulator
LKKQLIELTTDVVSSFVMHNSVPRSELSEVFQTVHATLQRLENGGEAVTVPEREPAPPAVPVRKSITPEYLICLDDGRKFKSLRRHLATLGMTPEQYRAKWSLPDDYPMVAPNYAAVRSELAKKIGLGRKPVRAAG